MSTLLERQADRVRAILASIHSDATVLLRPGDGGGHLLVEQRWIVGQPIAVQRSYTLGTLGTLKDPELARRLADDGADMDRLLVRRAVSLAVALGRSRGLTLGYLLGEVDL